MIYKNRKWLAFLITFTLMLMFIPTSVVYAKMSSFLQGFNVNYGGNGSLDLRWQNANLGNGWAEGEWVPYQLVITGMRSSYGSTDTLANMPEIVIGYQAYAPNGGVPSKFVDLVRGFQVKATQTSLSSTQLNLFKLTNSNQGWPQTQSDPIGATDYAKVEAAQNANFYTDPLWPSGGGADWEVLEIDPEQINLGPPEKFNATTKIYDYYQALDPYGSYVNSETGKAYSDNNGYLFITDDQLIEAYGDDIKTADTIVIYFQLHLSRTSLWNSGLYHGYGVESNPAYDWGGWIYGVNGPGEFGTLASGITMPGSSSAPGSSGDARVKIYGQGDQTVSIPVPKQPPGRIAGYKWRDVDNDGEDDGLAAGEGPLADWPMYLSAEIDGMAFVLKTTTDENGNFSFENLTYGMRYLTEGLPDDWSQTHPTTGLTLANGAVAFDTTIDWTSPTSLWGPGDGSYEAYLNDDIVYKTADVSPPIAIGPVGYEVELKAPVTGSKDPLLNDPALYIKTGLMFGNRQVGYMKITKTFTGYTDVVGFNPATMLPTSITVNIKGNTTGLSYPTTGTDVTINRTGTGTAEDPYKWEWISGMLAPGSYNVSKSALSGWDLTFDPADGNVTVVAGSTTETAATVSLTNTYKPGHLKIIKLFTGYDGVVGFIPSSMLPTSIDIKISGKTTGLSYPTTGSTVTINRLGAGTAGDPYKWEFLSDKLIPGTYIFEEVSTFTNFATPTYDPTSKELVVTAGTTPAAGAIGTITNTFEPGKMKIIKLFTGYSGVVGFDPEDMLPESLTVNVKGKVSGLSYPTTGSDITIGRTGAGSSEDPYKWEWISDKLIPGTYTFEEVSTFTNFATPTYDPTSKELVVTAGATPAAGAIGTITNTFEPGKMKIIKLFTGYAGVRDFDPTTMLPSSLTVKISGKAAGLSYPTTGTNITINRTGAGTAGDPYKWEWTSDMLIPGTYTFEEVSTFTNFATPTYDPTSKELVVTAGTAPASGAIGTITNTFEPGYLKVVKNFTGYVDVKDFDPTALPASIIVTIKGNTTGLSYPTTGTDVTITRTGAGTTGDPFKWEWTSGKLIPGSYNVSKTALSGWDLTFDPADGNVTVVAGSTTETAATVSLTNTYKPGHLKIIKLFTGYDDVVGFIPSSMLPTSIDVKISGKTTGLSYPTTGSTVTINRLGAGTAGDPYKWEFLSSKLIPGTYTFEEVSTFANFAAPTYDPVSKELVVVAGTEPAAGAIGTITNTFEPGYLKIIKNFTGYSDESMLPESITVNIKGATSGLSYDTTTGADIVINRTGSSGAYVYEWTSGKLIPGSYIFSEVSVLGWTPSYNPTDRILTVVSGTEPAAGAIGTITNVLNYHNETIWAMAVEGTEATGFAGTGNWGWWNGPMDQQVEPYVFELWAGAANNDTSKGMLVGILEVTYLNDSLLLEIVETYEGAIISSSAKVWISDEEGPPEYPQDFYVVPSEGTINDITGTIYFAYHGVAAVPG